MDWVLLMLVVLPFTQYHSVLPVVRLSSHYNNHDPALSPGQQASVQYAVAQACDYMGRRVRELGAMHGSVPTCTTYWPDCVQI